VNRKNRILEQLEELAAAGDDPLLIEEMAATRGVAWNGRQPHEVRLSSDRFRAAPPFTGTRSTATKVDFSEERRQLAALRKGPSMTEDSDDTCNRCTGTGKVNINGKLITCPLCNGTGGDENNAQDETKSHVDTDDLRERNASIIDRASAILDLAEAESRDLSVHERQRVEDDIFVSEAIHRLIEAAEVFPLARGNGASTSHGATASKPGAGYSKRLAAARRLRTLQQVGATAPFTALLFHG
jgi:hypothetical protein